MLKRIVAMLLFVAMAMTMLAACNGNTTPGTKGEVNFKVPETGFDAETPITITFMNTMGSNLATVLEAYIAEFEAMFPNIDVQKVRNFDDDSDHFWSLVSIDGGEHYYHFDATPRSGSGDSFCLVTDAFLNAYSGDHKGSHNRDESLYPATPEEDL